MKKLLVVVAMIMGLGTSVAFASTSVDSTAVAQSQQNLQDEFKSIEAKELPSEVMNALAKDFDGGTIKEAFVAEKASGKIFKVVAVAKDGQESTVFFNEKGEAVSETGELIQQAQAPAQEEPATPEEPTAPEQPAE